MKIQNPKCPECGELAMGTVDFVPAVALFGEIDADGNTEWAGESKLFWDGQETYRDQNGLPKVQCHNGHEWATEIGA